MMKIQTLLAHAQSRITHFSQDWERIIDEEPALWEALESLKIEPRFNFGDGCIDICFAGDASLMQAAWQVIRATGYQPDARPAAKKSTFSTHWHRAGSPVIWFYFTSNQCKAVQVGTKMVEEPVYEIQCESDLSALLPSENDNPLAREG